MPIAAQAATNRPTWFLTFVSRSARSTPMMRLLKLAEDGSLWTCLSRRCVASGARVPRVTQKNSVGLGCIFRQPLRRAPRPRARADRRASYFHRVENV